MKLAVQLANVSDKTLEIAKLLSRITLTLDSWDARFGIKYWYDGFSSSTFKNVNKKEFEASYAGTTTFCNSWNLLNSLELPQFVPRAEKIIESKLAKFTSEISRLGSLVEANQNTFNAYVNPLTTCDEDVFEKFSKASDVDTWRDYSKELKAWNGSSDIPQNCLILEEEKNLTRVLKQTLSSLDTTQLKKESALLKKTKDRAFEQLASAKSVIEITVPDTTAVNMGIYQRYVKKQINILNSREVELVKNRFEYAQGIYAQRIKDARAQEDLQVGVDIEEILETLEFESVNWTKNLARINAILTSMGSGEELQKKLQEAKALIEKILKIEADAHLPKKETKKPTFVDLAASLSAEEKAAYDSWRAEIHRVHSAFMSLQASISELSKKLNLRRTSLTDVVPKSNLRSFFFHLFNDERYQLLMTEEVLGSVLQNLMKPKNRLLVKDDVVGIVEMPVLISKGFIDQTARNELQNVGFNLDRVVGSYSLLKDALVLGVNTDIKNVSLAHLTKKLTHVISRMLDTPLKSKLQSLRPLGPSITKGAHTYLVLVPQTINEGMTLEQWSFSIGKM